MEQGTLEEIRETQRSCYLTLDQRAQNLEQWIGDQSAESISSSQDIVSYELELDGFKYAFSERETLKRCLTAGIVTEENTDLFIGGLNGKFMYHLYNAEILRGNSTKDAHEFSEYHSTMFTNLLITDFKLHLPYWLASDQN
jgi:hypothetical protein